MAVVEALLPADPAAVYQALTTPSTYPLWLVGCQDIRSVDEGWPAPGTRFHHRVGLLGPLTVADDTEALEAVPAERLALEVRARPFGRGRVTFTLVPREGGRTLLRFEEVPIGPLRPAQPALDPLTVRRNRRSLERLSALLRVSRILGSGEAPGRGV
jgi:uncharacterized protein YndB with AHSA1/START domain